MPTTLIAPPAPTKLREVALHLPVAPQIMARLYSLLLDVNSNLPSVSALICQDASLSARVLRVANSPGYGGHTGTIDEAINRVGFGEVYRMVGLAASEATGRNDLIWHGFTSKQLLTHNLGMALAAELIAPHIGADPRAAYTAGLLRAIGVVVLDTVAQETTRTHPEFVSHKTGLVAQEEHDVLGFSYNDVTRIVLAEWHFPGPIINAAALDAQHTLHPIPTPLTRAIILADALLQTTAYILPGCGLPGNTLAGTEIETVADRLRADLGTHLDRLLAA